MQTRHKIAILLGIVAILTVSLVPVQAAYPSAFLNVNFRPGRFNERIYAYGFAGRNAADQYQCVPGCGPNDYINTNIGAGQTFTSYPYRWREGGWVIIEAFFGMNRTRYTYCWIQIPKLAGRALEVYYNLDYWGNLSCSVGLSHD